MSTFRNRDLWSGALFVTVGLLALVLGRNYEIGTAVQMRAGYVPTVLAWLLCGIGVLVGARGVVVEDPVAARIQPCAARPFLVVLAVVIFAVLLERAGLAIATLILTVLAGSAAHDLHKHELATLALTLAAISVAVFIWGLGLPLRLWPAF